MSLCQNIVSCQTAVTDLNGMGVLDLVALSADQLRAVENGSTVVLECANLLAGLLGGGVTRMKGVDPPSEGGKARSMGNM